MKYLARYSIGTELKHSFGLSRPFKTLLESSGENMDSKVMFSHWRKMLTLKYDGQIFNWNTTCPVSTFASVIFY